MNPFTLKELRQLTRTKTISGALVFFLFAALLITYLVPLDGITHQTGAIIAHVILMLLLAIFSVVLPINVFVRMTKERRGRSADLTLVTPLPPSSIIDGKLRSAYALMFLFSSAALPFGVAAYLLHGITFAAMLQMLGLVVFYSSLVVHFVLAIASLRCAAVWRIVLFILTMLQVLPTLMSGLILLPFFCQSEDIESYLVTLAVLGTASLFLRAQAIAWISPKVRERGGPLRRVSLVAVVLWHAYVFFRYWNGDAGACCGVFEKTCTLSTFWAIYLAVYAMAQEVGQMVRHFAFALILGLCAGCVLPLVAPHLNELFRLQEVMEKAGEFRTVVDPERLLVVFAYVTAAMMYVRSGWFFLKRRLSVAPVLVPIAAFAVLFLYQTIPGALAVSGKNLDFSTVPFNLLPYSGNASALLPSAALAFAWGLLLLLPEIANHFRRK